MIIKERRTMSERERRELSYKIRIALLDGDEESEIMTRCDCTLANVKNITAELLRSGAVKKQDIRAAREAKRRNERRIGIPLSQQHRAECKERILERIRAKDIKSFAKFAGELGISAPTLRKLINELIAARETTDDEVSNAVQDKRSKVKINKNYIENDASGQSSNLDSAEQGKASREEMKSTEYNKIIIETRDMVEEMISYDRGFNTQTVIAYVAAVKGLFSMNYRDLERDMDILRRVIPMNEALLTAGNVNLVITYFTRKKRTNTCLSFIDECIDSTSEEAIDLMR
ncbi:MAG: hypothetical protein HFJ51_06575 [Clostridia bacterium]|nr:hypothetical protein [Clostridia bacterium]